jgi:hypothetical protein
MDIYLDDEHEPVKMVNSEIMDNQISLIDILESKISDVKSLKNKAKTINCENSNNRISKNEKVKLIQELISKVFENVCDTNISEKNKIENKEEIYVIDRFEGNYAVCENRETKEMVNVVVSKLPEDIKEGDVLTYKDNSFFKNEDLQREIEDRIREKVKNIFED